MMEYVTFSGPDKPFGKKTHLSRCRFKQYVLHGIWGFVDKVRASDVSQRLYLLLYNSVVYGPIRPMTRKGTAYDS